MSMELNSYATGGGVALPLFRVGRAELGDGKEPVGGTETSGGIGLGGGFGLDEGLGSTPVTVRRLAGGVLAWDKRMD